jgi:hypothetical protein
MDPPGGMRPSLTGKMRPSDSTSESAEMYLKMIALVYWEMGRKGFPESDLMLAREPECVRQKCRTSKSGKCTPDDSSIGI